MHGGYSRSAGSEGGEVFGRLRRFVRSQNLRIFARFYCRSPCGWLICFLSCFCHAWRLAACFARTRPARVRNVQTTLIKQDNKPNTISLLCYSTPTQLQAKLKRRVKHIILFSFFARLENQACFSLFAFTFNPAQKENQAIFFYPCLILESGRKESRSLLPVLF